MEKKENNDSWYDKERIFSIQFCLHMLAYVMCELKQLIKKIQEEHIDDTSLWTTIDVTVNTLRRLFLRHDTFPNGAC